MYVSQSCVKKGGYRTVPSVGCGSQGSVDISQTQESSGGELGTECEVHNEEEESEDVEEVEDWEEEEGEQEEEEWGVEAWGVRRINSTSRTGKGDVEIFFSSLCYHCSLGRVVDKFSYLCVFFFFVLCQYVYMCGISAFWS